MKELMLSIPSFNQRRSTFNTVPLVPESQLLFAGPLSCARHGLRGGENFRREGRISYLILAPEDIALGSYQKKVLCAAEELQRTRKIRALVLQFCCQNALIGTDYKELCLEIEQQTGVLTRYVEVNRLYVHAKNPRPMISPMVPEVIASFLQKTDQRDCAVNLIGTNAPPDQRDSLFAFLKTRGIESRHITDFDRFEDFQSMARSRLTICLSPESEPAAVQMEQTLGIPFLPLYPSLYPPALLEQYRAIGQFFGAELIPEDAYSRCMQLLESVSKEAGSQPVIIAGERMNMPFSFARSLIERGCEVHEVRYDHFGGEEAVHKAWLETHASTTKLRKLSPEGKNEPYFYCPMAGHKPDHPHVSEPVGFHAVEMALKGGSKT